MEPSLVSIGDELSGGGVVAYGSPLAPVVPIVLCAYTAGPATIMAEEHNAAARSLFMAISGVAKLA